MRAARARHGSCISALVAYAGMTRAGRWAGRLSVATAFLMGRHVPCVVTGRALPRGDRCAGTSSAGTRDAPAASWLA